MKLHSLTESTLKNIPEAKYCFIFPKIKYTKITLEENLTITKLNIILCNPAMMILGFKSFENLGSHKNLHTNFPSSFI